MLDDRRVLSGIVHALRNGGRWADCPREVYGPKKTHRFVRWAERGSGNGYSARSAVHRFNLHQGFRRKRGALAHGIGRTKGGRNTKLHAVCDAKGRPLVLLLTPGNVHDCKVAQRCIEAMPPAAELVADKGYDSKALRDWLAERGTTAVIPPRRTARSNTIMTRPSTGSATSSSDVLPPQGLAPYPASTATSQTSSPQSPLPPPSSGG